LPRLKFAAGLTAAAFGLAIFASSGVAAAAGSSSTHVTDVAHHHRAKKAHHRHYQVQNGDSMWSIAQEFHVDWYNLAADNGLHMYSVLHPGTVLVIPNAGEPPHAAMPLTPGATASSSSSTTTPASSTSTSSTTSTTTPTTASSASTSSAGESSFEQCVISHESGGDPDATNGQYWGLFQFSEATWVAYGGNASEWGNASAGAQEQVFANAVAAGGESNWAPYDGC
jgi:LysM repeat protein